MPRRSPTGAGGLVAASYGSASHDPTNLDAKRDVLTGANILIARRPLQASRVITWSITA
ncbi:hypothetical protein [Bradyrhizobium sp. AZCC 2230]|uniref:hypothetical protein n=1 Tax=Bradyrhizobium sp. AZCC 2230 TaxID=3117021 RepID=UPI002FF3372A